MSEIFSPVYGMEVPKPGGLSSLDYIIPHSYPFGKAYGYVVSDHTVLVHLIYSVHEYCCEHSASQDIFSQ